MRTGDGDRVELVVMIGPPDFGGFHFQYQRVAGELDCGQRDFVLVIEVRNRLHVRIAVTSTNGIDCMAMSARTSCGVPTVLSQMVASVVAPGPMKSAWPAKSASSSAAGPTRCVHEVFTSPRPAALVFFSINCCASMTIIGR